MFNHGAIWGRHLAKYRGKPVQYVEVGSFEGMSVAWMMQNILTHPESAAICIDPWLPYMNFASRFTPVFENFVKNTGAYASRIVSLRGTSREHLKQLPEDRFDIAYIDGAHEMWSVLEDLVLLWPLMRIGSTVIIDDYGTPNKHPLIPKAGIDAFLEIYGPKLIVDHVGWQVVLRKIES